MKENLEFYRVDIIRSMGHIHIPKRKKKENNFSKAPIYDCRL